MKKPIEKLFSIQRARFHLKKAHNALCLTDKESWVAVYKTLEKIEERQKELEDELRETYGIRC